MKVSIVTEEQKDLIIGQEFDTDSHFNPILDANDNWVITDQEINQTTSVEFIWVKDLVLIEYNPILISPLI